MENSILNECKLINNKLVELRRELHKFPEIGDNLPITRDIVIRELKSMGIEYRLNKSDTGIVADIVGGHSGKTIAFRADMDGLHIDEKTDMPFKSEIEGQMHGCGHDAHTAILLMAAKVINEHKDDLSGRVRLIFQTGEETGTGAKTMISEGVLEGVDSVCAVHVGNLSGDELKAGTLALIPGPVTAGKDKFVITVNGKGTHSAYPQNGIDPILIAARIVNACEEIKARELPATSASVLSFGSFNAGIDHNTIPDKAVIKGSIRAQLISERDFIGERLKEICESISKAFRAECNVDLKRGSQTVMNDEKITLEFADELRKYFGDEVITTAPSPLMGSDDFANYASKVPSVMFFLTTNNQEKGIIERNHNPKFDIDEDVLWRGVLAYVVIALKYLK